MKILILFLTFVSGKSKSSGGGGASVHKQSEEQNEAYGSYSNGDYPGSMAAFWNSAKMIWDKNEGIIVACVLG